MRSIERGNLQPAPLWLALLVAGGCSTTPRMVVPLRYDEALDVPTRPRSDPPPRGAAQHEFACPNWKSTVLSNGLQVIVVQKHSFPTVAAQLFFDRDWVDLGDMTDRLTRAGSTFLSPIEGGEEDTGAGCSRSGCSLASWAVGGQLESILDRFASLALTENEAPDAYARRLATVNTQFRKSEALPKAALWRNAYALAFGRSIYGWPGTMASDATLAQLKETRDEVLTPDRATLAIAGDVSADEVVPAVERRFGTWPARAFAQPDAAPPPEPQGPRVVMVRNAFASRPLAYIVVAGPPAGDDDATAFSLAANLMGASRTSDAFAAVRENQEAAYAVGVEVAMHRETTLLLLGGPMDAEKVVDALRTLLRVVAERAAREPSPEDLERAKMQVLAALRGSTASNAWLARYFASRPSSGRWPSGPWLDPCDAAKKIDATSAPDVLRVARRYFDRRRLGVVVVGGASLIEPWLDDLGLGRVVDRDGFSRDMAR